MESRSFYEASKNLQEIMEEVKQDRPVKRTYNSVYNDMNSPNRHERRAMKAMQRKKEKSHAR